MQEGTPIKQYIEEFNKAVLDYQNVAKSLDTDHIAILFLCSLLDSYDCMRYQILYGTNSISMDDITSILLSKDLLRKSNMESGQSKGLVVSRGRSTKCGHSGDGASGSGRGKSKGRSKSRQATKLSADIARIMAI